MSFESFFSGLLQRLAYSLVIPILKKSGIYILALNKRRKPELPLLGTFLRLQTVSPDEITDDDVRFYVETYVPQNDMDSYEWWQRHNRIGLTRQDDNSWGIEYGNIRKMLQEENYPFKFVCNVPKDKVGDYCYALLDADCIVTGRGKPALEEGEIWDLWFLRNELPLHEQPQDFFRMNHCLPPRA